MASRIELQQQLEELFSKNQLLPRIRKEFEDSEDFDFKAYFEHKGINVNFGFDVMVQMALHKRADMQTMVGLTRRHFNTAQECADELEKMNQADLIDWHEGLKLFIVKVTISAEVQAELDRFQFPLPMVVKPVTLKKNSDSAYLLGNSSVILKGNHHNEDVVLEHLNRVNAVKYCIDMETAQLVKNKWKSLDKVKEGETREDLERRRKAFAKYDATAHDVMSLLLSQGNEFYLTHRYDKRGRTYCQGYHVNNQGTAWNKAVINFAEGEVTE